MNKLSCLFFSMFAGILYTFAIESPDWEKDTVIDPLPAKENDAVIKEFGIKKGEPIDNGFFFWNGRYVEPPYIVESRGLDIYINNIRVQNGPLWAPPPPSSTPSDPGDPPANVLLYDKYWRDKWKYLVANNTRSKARELLASVYRTVKDVKEVCYSPQCPDFFIITDHNNKSWNIDFGTYGFRPSSKNDLLISRDKMMYRYERLLRLDEAIEITSSGFECCLQTNQVIAFLDTLASSAPKQEKIDRILLIVFHFDRNTEKNQTWRDKILKSDIPEQVEMFVTNFTSEKTLIAHLDCLKTKLSIPITTATIQSALTNNVRPKTMTRPLYSK